MTEDDAKTKWCPETRVALRAGHAANMTANMDANGQGYANIHDETRCQASGCMMWRWASYKRVDGYCGKAGAVDVSPE